MILYKNIYDKSPRRMLFNNLNFWLGGSASRQLGSAGAFRPDPDLVNTRTASAGNRQKMKLKIYGL